MRKKFVSKLLEWMEKDEQVVFLTGDLGFGSFEVIQEKYPRRFFNMGIAEQNMIGVACGLSLVGKKIIIYSIANFATLRVIEQIRNYLTYHHCHVLIVTGGGGFSYGQLGYTHHAIEDIPMMKAIPHMQIYAPANSCMVEEAMEQWYLTKQTAYLRLEKNEAVLPEPLKKYSFGYCYGGQVVTTKNNFVVTYGTIVEEAMKIKNILDEKKIALSIIILNMLKMKDESLYHFVHDAERVLFLEENTMHSGMGEHFFARCMLHNISIARSKIAGVADFISETNGEQQYLRNIHQLDAKNLLPFFLA